MKCRSDPHVVDALTRRMTSRGLTIVGSGTVSTRRSLTPFQQRARMIAVPSGRPSGRLHVPKNPGRALLVTLRFRVGARACGRVLLGRGDLAGFDEALEAPERVLRE